MDRNVTINTKAGRFGLTKTRTSFAGVVIVTP